MPNFDFRAGYTAFQFVFVLLQSSAFGGVFTGFGIALDFETGIARRLMLAAPRRAGIVLGYLLAALFRTLLVWALPVAAFIVGVVAIGLRTGRAPSTELTDADRARVDAELAHARVADEGEADE